jgi:hypothetical protein
MLIVQILYTYRLLMSYLDHMFDFGFDLKGGRSGRCYLINTA